MFGWAVRGQDTMWRPRGRVAADNFEKDIFMTAIVQTVFRTVHSVREVHPLTQIAMFCAAGIVVSLLASLLALTYGLDLSWDFF
jgi:hypothetical protein